MTAVLAASILAFDLVLPPWWGFLVAFLLVILGGIVATSFAGPNLAAVGISPDDQLLVRPVGLVRLWALSKGHECPVTAIADVGVADRKTLARKWKTVGTHLPGVMTAGRFRSHHETDLWMVGRSKEVLVIELHDQPFRHLVVQVEDPHAAVEALRAAMNRER